MPPVSDSTVLAVVEALARELGGSRHPGPIALTTDLERELGFGSLERVELLVRLEATFGVALDDDVASARTPGELLVRLAALAPTLPAAPHGNITDLLPSMRAEVQPERFRSLQDALLTRTEEDPSAIHAVIRDGDREPTVVTRAALLEAAEDVAATLGAHELAPGERVALLHGTSESFLSGFLGILLAGAVPVPLAPPPRSDRLEEHATRQRRILADAGARYVLAPRAVPGITVISPEGRQPHSGIGRVRGATSDSAFIQYTSGSTGHPKGVLLDHGAVLANIRAIGEAVDVRADDVVVSWLPLHHDMGLVGSWLFALVHGLPIVLLPPVSFLVRPERWLTAIHLHRGSLAAAPNFGYELCTRRVSDDVVAGLELSSWRAALNGSEPVLPRTLVAFAERFGPVGFRRQAFRPVYGLAESAVALTIPPRGREPRVERIVREALEVRGEAQLAAADDARAIPCVALGPPLPEHDLRILDDDGRERPPRRVGRIVFRGPSAMRGYFGQAEATAEITIHLDGQDYFDTGDLGWKDESGELFVTGRVKDLIIHGGRNLLPAEIEDAALRVDGVRAAAAFGVLDEALGSERIVLVAETRVAADARTGLESALTAAVTDAIGLPPHEIALVLPGAIPRTSSGKIRRGACREAFVRGELGKRRKRMVDANGGEHSALGSGLRRALDFLRVLPAMVFLPVLAILTWAIAPFLPAAAMPALQRALARAVLWLVGGSLKRTPPIDLPAPAVIVANHSSYFDVLALLATLPPDIRFLAKIEVEKWPFVGIILRRGGHLTVDRNSERSGRNAAFEVARRLSRGERVVIFPEGTFTRSIGIRPFKLGAFVAARRAGCPIVPVGLVGLRRLLQAGRWLPHPSTVEVHVGAPIDPGGEDWGALVELRDRSRKALAELSGEPLLDSRVAGIEGLTERRPDESHG